MSLRGSDDAGGVRFAALPGTVAGYGGRGVEGAAYGCAGSYLFTDNSGDSWWIIFQLSADAASRAAQVRGDVLACSASHGEVTHVRELAIDVRRVDADAAFRDNAPASYEDAAAVAAGIPAANG